MEIVKAKLNSIKIKGELPEKSDQKKMLNQQAKKRKQDGEDLISPPTEDEINELINDVSDTLHKLTLQQQTEFMINSLISSGTESKMLDDDKSMLINTPSSSQKQQFDEKIESKINIAMIEEMQSDEQVVLNVGGQFFHTTTKTLFGKRGNSNVQTKKVAITGASLASSSGSRKSNQDDDGEDDGESENQNTESGKESNTIDQGNDLGSLEYVCAQDNLFKVMFDSGFGIERDHENKSAINFQDRNPQYFEYILEHLRQGGRVKSLGIEKLNVEELENILMESQYFLTEKLSEYILFLLNKYHRYDSSLTVENEQTPIEYSHPIPKQETREFIKETEKKIQMIKQNIAQTSQQLVEKYNNFLVGNDIETDLSVKINIAGQYFTIPFTYLRKFENFIISKYILSPNFKLNEEGCIFIDRSPKLFAYIHGYIMSDGKFYHFPKYMCEEKKLQLKKEAEFYGMNTLVNEYLDPLRYPVELLGEDNIKLKQQEDRLRELFANNRENPLLNDPYMTLSPLFSKYEEIKNAEKYKLDLGSCPTILNLSDKTQYSRHAPQPQLVNSLGTFKMNWYRFTQGVLEGLDWNGVFAAG